MADDQHPADELVNSIKGLFNGENLKQAVREAWDRLHGNQQPPVPNAHDQQAAAAAKRNNDAAVQRANKEFLDMSQAQKIREKAGKVVGK